MLTENERRRITDLAHYAGIRSATAYREQFGMLPSHTLQQRLAEREWERMRRTIVWVKVLDERGPLASTLWIGEHLRGADTLKAGA